MSLTLADYVKASDDFVEHLCRIETDIRSAFLFGSMVRGEAVPGYSDLDYWVFLKPAAMADRSRFMRVLRMLTEASCQLMASGIPVHNACCYYRGDHLDQLPAMLVPNLKSRRASAIVVGEDIRDELESAAASRRSYQAASFFEMRRQLYHPLAPLLQQQDLTKEERYRAFISLQYVKYLPESACATLDLWPGEQAALETLQQAIPGLDATAVGQVKAFCVQMGPNAGASAFRDVLRLTLEFVETLNERLVTISERNG